MRGPNWNLEEFLEGEALTSHVAKCTVTGLAVDHRKLDKGDLFMACLGGQSHGLDYADAAIAAGAAAIIYDVETARGFEASLALWSASVPVVGVCGLATRQAELAQKFYGNPSRNLRVFGVTGTNGKTSCVQYLSEALGVDMKCGVIGTLGYGVAGQIHPTGMTTPDAVSLQGILWALLTSGCQVVVMEVSSHALDQGRVAGIEFEGAMLTNLTHDHLDYHGDMETYGNAKRLLFEGDPLKVAVVNCDDAFGADLMDMGRSGVFYCGVSLSADSGKAMIRGDLIEVGLQGIRMCIHSGDDQTWLQSPLLGQTNAQNLLLVFSMLLHFGIVPLDAAKRLSQVKAVPGRMERFGGGSYPDIIVDYAHTPDAFAKALGFLKHHSRGLLWCLFGCGGERDQEKRPLMGKIAEQFADKVVVTDDNPRQESAESISDAILSGMDRPENVEVIHDRMRAITHVLQGAASNDVVLIAGKGHEDKQWIGGESFPFSDREVVRTCLDLVA